MSRKNLNYRYPLKVSFIFLADPVLHFEISDKSFNNEQLLSIPIKLITLLIFQYEISGSSLI